MDCDSKLSCSYEKGIKKFGKNIFYENLNFLQNKSIKLHKRPWRKISLNRSKEIQSRDFYVYLLFSYLILVAYINFRSFQNIITVDF